MGKLPKWPKRLKNVKLRTKLVISFALLIVVPISIIGWLYFRNSSSVLSEMASKNVYEIVRKNTQIMDAKLSKVNESTLSIPSDPDLYKAFSAVSNEEQPDIIEMDRQVTKVLQKYFSQSADVISAVLATSYYSFGASNGAFLAANYISGENYTSSQLYARAKEAKGGLVWIPTYDFTVMFNHPGLSLGTEARYSFSAAKLVNSYYLDNATFDVLDNSIERPTLIINFKETSLASIYEESIPIKGAQYFIVTSEGRVVSCADKSSLSKILDFPWLAEAVHGKSGSRIFYSGKQKYIVCYDTSTVTGWISAAVIPFEGLMRDILPAIQTYTVLIVGIFFLISIPLVYLLSGVISSPIRKLLAAMKKMGEGNFDIHIPVERKDELGYFVEKFNILNEKIKMLIEENYEVKLREKETEIMALNLQMNPHFLYNTLNLVNWMAIEAKQDNISNIIMELCSMLVYTLKHKGETASLKDDMEWLQCYLHIISCRFEDKFSVRTDIAPELDQLRVPKLFLQPFVENSIIHGFEYMDGGCQISIVGRLEAGEAVFEIEDNGIGMDQERIDQIMNMETSSIGVRNVDKRIKLLYGEQYGVAIASQVGKGTRVIVRIPAEDSRGVIQ